MEILVELKELKDRKFMKANGDKVEGKHLKFVISREIEGVSLNANLVFSKSAFSKYAEDLTEELGKTLTLEIKPVQNRLAQYMESDEPESD